MLTDPEKYFLAIGLVLAKDYLQLEAKDDEERFQLAVTQAVIVNKLGVDKEFGKACAETASLGNVFKQAAQEIRKLGKG